VSLTHGQLAVPALDGDAVLLARDAAQHLGLAGMGVDPGAFAQAMTRPAAANSAFFIRFMTLKLLIGSGPRPSRLRCGPTCAPPPERDPDGA
jgi:hypothetical protein